MCWGRGLVNQGWKDSGDAIVNADGSLARPPIALVEVQAYTYAAWIATADLLRRARDVERATDLERRATALRDRFECDFWLADLSAYALALQAGGEPVAVGRIERRTCTVCGYRATRARKRGGHSPDR